MICGEPYSGYQKAKKSQKAEGCQDINECGRMDDWDSKEFKMGFDSDICHESADCYNTPGAFRSRYSKSDHLQSIAELQKMPYL